MDELHEGDGSYHIESMQYVEQNATLIFGLLDFVSGAMQANRDWLQAHFGSNLVKAQLAPWVLHAGLEPESAFSGLIGPGHATLQRRRPMPAHHPGRLGIMPPHRCVSSRRGGSVSVPTALSSKFPATGRGMPVSIKS
jgi:phytoene dehydrogenase-like protein